MRTTGAGGGPPTVSVLMTTRDGADLLPETLDSALAQRFRDFELVVVDDASTDATPALLAAYAARDPRLRVLRPGSGLGVVGARNLGFAACRGRFLAALDHDDLSHPDRLGAQVAYLDAHPRTALVGTAALLTDGRRGRVSDYDTEGAPLPMRWALHVGNPLTWSSVMLRVDAVRRLGGPLVRPDYEYADDFDLYHRLLAVGEVARLDAPLTTYRWHARNTTRSRGGALFDGAARVLAGAYRPWLGAEAREAAELVIRHLSDRVPPRDAATVLRLGGILERVLDGFLDSHALPPAERAAVAALAARSWWRVVRGAARTGMPGALALRGARADLCRGWAPSRADLLVSGAVGALRAVRPLVRLPRRRGS